MVDRTKEQTMNMHHVAYGKHQPQDQTTDTYVVPLLESIIPVLW